MQWQSKDTVFSKNRTLCLGEKLILLDHPLIMGTLNLSPESFYFPDKPVKEKDAEWFLSKAAEMIPYCDIIDIGAVSTRPGAPVISVEVEISRISNAFPKLTSAFPGFSFSLDTYRAKAAEMGASLGACLINDISGGTLDPDLLPVVASLKLPYVYSHIQGSPVTMQKKPQYQDVTKEVLQYFAKGLQALQELGIEDIIIDPGFGFGKTVEHNYILLRSLEEFQYFQRPVMVGLSRKSMIQKVLNTDAGNSLNGSTVLNTIALLKGADILRVHDPREAKEAAILVEKIKSV